ncbi:hypothetical protein SJI19_23145 [Acerihabitans sp. TG2]|uniref:hypothetical protein n=1 Tax=Acerihabitans sp. TG2 TaxID=3096008 RepID=UPI002B2274B0|nr:hypothetical protein [Acerihabitans sp. TG2]MEA9393395.1 hypothetical protein [Acerihabitans sp. TG2]
MNVNCLLKIIILLSITLSPVAVSDVIIRSPFGTKLIFSEKKSGKNYDADAWGKLSFKGHGETIDLGIDGRYFTESASSHVSPSGKYLVVNSISGGYLYSADGTKKYVDRAYCSVIDMEKGCYISDWTGGACGYDWRENEDILENSPGSDTFDFLSFRPRIKHVKDNLSSLYTATVKVYLRCDAPDQTNINTYQELIKVNKKAKPLTTKYITKYLSSITTEKTIITKSYLFSSPDNNNQTKAYLVSGDKIKVIQNSPDNKWVNMGYINAKGTPLIAWVMADALAK